MSQSDEDRATILNAVITNTRCKVIFGGLAPDDAELLARVIFPAHDLQEWKEASVRMTPVGNRLVHTHSAAHAVQDALHEMAAETDAIAHSRARSVMHAEGRATMSGKTRARSRASALGATDADAATSGITTGQGDTASLALAPQGGILSPPEILGQGTAQSSTTALTNLSTQSRALSRVDTEGEIEGEIDAVSEIESDAIAETVGDAISKARTQARGATHGTTDTEGVGEAYVTEYEPLPMQFYSLEEQHHRAIAALITLDLRECFVKLTNTPALRTRTVDHEPAFRSDYAKRVLLPLYLQKINALSPFVLPISQVDAEIDARTAEILKPAPPPAPDFSAQPVPGLDDVLNAPGNYAAEFWKRQPAANPRAPKRPSREPQPGEPALTIIDGGRSDGDNNA